MEAIGQLDILIKNRILYGYLGIHNGVVVDITLMPSLLTVRGIW